jgi:predicted XRE-type DNA-binding protein
MALAIYYEDLIRQGHVHDYAEIATLGHVTRARVTQIMNLRLLAPEIQESLLDLSRVDGGRDAICLRSLQGIALVLNWSQQREIAAKLLKITG